MNRLIVFTIATAITACNASNQSQMKSSTDSSGNETTSSTSGNSSNAWVRLFDGKTTNGWHSYGKPSAGKAWKVEDSTLHLDAASKKSYQTAEGGDLLTNDEYDNFHLKLEWKIEPKGNSGIIFYIKEDSSKYKESWNTGLEMQVLDNGSGTNEGHPDAKINKHRAGDLYDLITAKEAVKPAGEWNLAEIVADHGKLDFYLNGQHTLSTTLWDDNWKKLVANSKFKTMPDFGTFKKGKIALQDHGNNVWFRNIEIQKL